MYNRYDGFLNFFAGSGREKGEKGIQFVFVVYVVFVVVMVFSIQGHKYDLIVFFEEKRNEARDPIGSIAGAAKIWT